MDGCSESKSCRAQARWINSRLWSIQGRPAWTTDYPLAWIDQFFGAYDIIIDETACSDSVGINEDTSWVGQGREIDNKPCICFAVKIVSRRPDTTDVVVSSLRFPQHKRGHRPNEKVFEQSLKREPLTYIQLRSSWWLRRHPTRFAHGFGPTLWRAHRLTREDMRNFLDSKASILHAPTAPALTG